MPDVLEWLVVVYEEAKSHFYRKRSADEDDVHVLPARVPIFLIRGSYFVLGVVHGSRVKPRGPDRVGSGRATLTLPNL